MNIQPAIDLLKAHHATYATRTTIETLAAAVGIDIEAMHSYREVAELVEVLALSPYVSRTWSDEDRNRRYHASGYVPYATTREDGGCDACDLAPSSTGHRCPRHKVSP